MFCVEFIIAHGVCPRKIKRGVEAHAAYQRLEWSTEAELAQLPEAFRVAFVRPSPEATVWRERSYEIFADGRWESGQFDRVVFAGAGAGRTATIYDFKTNALRTGETPAAFAARLQTAYRGQMAAYRAAVAHLTGLPPARIRAVLLLTATGQAVEMA